MNSADRVPFFTVIISTRDRPALLQTALRSVMGQSCTDREILVIVDGSAPQNMAVYRQFELDNPDIRFHFIQHKDTGHGQSYAMNVGVGISSGRYLCFLDDDDYWTDMDYLERVRQAIVAAPETVDVHFSNQKATFVDGRAQSALVWIEDLLPLLDRARPHQQDSYFVDATFMLQSAGFAHLNCSIFRREFYQEIGGMDESIRYENDRDVYIRAVDAARTILFSARYVSMHNIPDLKKKSNMSTVASDIDKKLYQMRVYDKGITQAEKPAVVKFCRRGKVYQLKHLTGILAQQGRYSSAMHYAREAMLSGFTVKWLLYTIYLSSLCLVHPGNGSRQRRA